MSCVLPQSFYERGTEEVARELLGKILVRRLKGEDLMGIIVETEAYFGADDPASRAFHGKKHYNKVMFEEPGHLFIYNVHKYWMLNFISHEGRVGGILIRAIEPTHGIETMQRNRPVNRIENLTSGPGKLTLALGVDNSLNGIDATTSEGEIYVLDNESEYELATSYRIGVTRDLPEKYRFYVKGNRFVSK